MLIGKSGDLQLACIVVENIIGKVFRAAILPFPVNCSIISISVLFPVIFLIPPIAPLERLPWGTHDIPCEL